MKSASAKAKGRRLQNEVRDRIKERWGFEPDTAVMGEKGKDVKDERLPYSIECKNVEKLNLWAAWQQAKDNLFEGDTPVVVFTRNRADTLAVVPLDWFIERMEIKEHGSVQPEGSGEAAGKTGIVPVEGHGRGQSCDTEAGGCVVRRSLEACGFVWLGTPGDQKPTRPANDHGDLT